MREQNQPCEASFDTLLTDFPVITILPVQWGDQDCFAHVNNTVYFRWCETARIEYFEQIGLPATPPGDGIGPILASIECNFRRPVKHPDTVAVGSRVTRIGNSSFQMEHHIASRRVKAIVAEASSTIVYLDYGRHKPVPLPASLRLAIARLEGQSL